MSKMISMYQVVKMTTKAGLGGYYPTVLAMLEEAGIECESASIGGKTYRQYKLADVHKFIRDRKGEMEQPAVEEEEVEYATAEQIAQVMAAVTEMKAKVDRIYADLCASEHQS